MQTFGCFSSRFKIVTLSFGILLLKDLTCNLR